MSSKLASLPASPAPRVTDTLVHSDVRCTLYRDAVFFLTHMNAATLGMALGSLLPGEAVPTITLPLVSSARSAIHAAVHPLTRCMSAGLSLLIDRYTAPSSHGSTTISDEFTSDTPDFTLFFPEFPPVCSPVPAACGLLHPRDHHPPGVEVVLLAQLHAVGLRRGDGESVRGSEVLGALRRCGWTSPHTSFIKARQGR
eukprot:195397-Pyramimonas_sp.AAC.2